MPPTRRAPGSRTNRTESRPPVRAHGRSRPFLQPAPSRSRAGKERRNATAPLPTAGAPAAPRDARARHLGTGHRQPLANLLETPGRPSEAQSDRARRASPTARIGAKLSPWHRDRQHLHRKDRIAAQVSPGLRLLRRALLLRPHHPDFVPFTTRSCSGWAPRSSACGASVRDFAPAPRAQPAPRSRQTADEERHPRRLSGADAPFRAAQNFADARRHRSRRRRPRTRRARRDGPRGEAPPGSPRPRASAGSPGPRRAPAS